MNRMAIVATLAFFCIVSRAADVTWTGTAEDQQWGSESNWSTGSLPGEKDTAKILVNTSVFMGADRTVGKLNLSGMGDSTFFNVDGVNAETGGKYTLTLAQGNIDGGKKAIVNANIYLPVNGAFTCDNGYGSKVTIVGDVSGPGELTLGGGQNRNAEISGGGTVSVPSVYCSLGGVTFDCSFVGTKLTLANAWSDGNGNRTNMRINELTTFDEDCEFWTDACGGVFNVYNSNVIDIERTLNIPILNHTSGKLSFGSYFYGGTNIVKFGAFTRRTGTMVTVGNNKSGSVAVDPGVNCGFVFKGESNNAAGIWGPWAVNNYMFLKFNENGALVQTDINKDYTAFPAGGVGCDANTKYKYTTENQTLTTDATVYSFLHYNGKDDDFQLGEYDLRMKGGAFIYQGNGVKTVSSTGGKLVFEGPDIILGTSGNNPLVINAPIAWDGSTSPEGMRPSLICSQLGMPIVLAGEDQVGVYSNMLAECGKSTYYIDFAGSSDRTIRGEIAGRFNIWKTGTGKLVFDGVNMRRSGGLYLSAGKTYMMTNTSPGVSIVSNGAEVVIGPDATWSGCTLGEDGILDGYGTYNAGYTVATGGIVGGGETDATGVLSFNGDFKLSAEAGFLCALDGETNSCVKLIGNKRKFTLPTEATELTLKVAWAGAADSVKVANRSFKFFDWGTSSNSSTVNPSTSITWKIENLTPKKIDTSEAVVTIDTTSKCIVLSGVKQNCGLEIIIH